MGEKDQIEKIGQENDGNLDMETDPLDMKDNEVVEKRDGSGNKVRNKTLGVVKKNLTRPAPKYSSVYMNDDTRRIVLEFIRRYLRGEKTVRTLPVIEIETPVESDGDAALDLDVQPTDCSKDTTKPNTRSSRDEENERISTALKLHRELLRCPMCREQNCFIKRGTDLAGTQIQKCKM